MDTTYEPPEYAAVCHILGAPRIAHRTAPFISEHDVDWHGLDQAAITMSGGEVLLVEIARELWNAEKRTGLWELPQRLDEANFERVLEALRLCRGTSRSRPIEEEGELAA